MAGLFTKLVVVWLSVVYQATGDSVFLQSDNQAGDLEKIVAIHKIAAFLAGKTIQEDSSNTEQDGNQNADKSEDLQSSEDGHDVEESNDSDQEVTQDVGESGDGGQEATKAEDESEDADREVAQDADQEVTQDAEEFDDAAGSQSGQGEEDKGELIVERTDANIRQKSADSPAQIEVDHNIHVLGKFGFLPTKDRYKVLVDSGAALSMMSEPVAKKLGLWSQVDRREKGQITGIGEANVVGVLHDILLHVGNAKFSTSFYVFSVQDDVVLLGVDTLSRYKCVLDLDRNLLLVGGLHGISVPFLPYVRAQDDWAH